MNYSPQLIQPNYYSLATIRPSGESPHQYHTRPHPQHEVSFNELIFAEIGGCLRHVYTRRKLLMEKLFCITKGMCLATNSLIINSVESVQFIVLMVASEKTLN